MPLNISPNGLTFLPACRDKRLISNFIQMNFVERKTTNNNQKRKLNNYSYFLPVWFTLVPSKIKEASNS